MDKGEKKLTSDLHINQSTYTQKYDRLTHKPLQVQNLLSEITWLVPLHIEMHSSLQPTLAGQQDKVFYKQMELQRLDKQHCSSDLWA